MSLQSGLLRRAPALLTGHNSAWARVGTTASRRAALPLITSRFSSWPGFAQAFGGGEAADPSEFAPLKWESEIVGLWDSGDATAPVGARSEVFARRVSEAIRPEDGVDARNMFHRQTDLEALALDRTVAWYKELATTMKTTKSAAGMRPAQRLFARWFAPLELAIDREQRAYMNNEHAPDRRLYGPCLLLLSPDKLAAITMHEALNIAFAHGGSCPLVNLAMSIGRLVQAEVGLQKLKSSGRKEWSKLTNLAQHKHALAVQRARSLLRDDDAWSNMRLVKLGSCLINLLLHAAQVPINEKGNLVLSYNPSTRDIPVSKEDDSEEDEEAPATHVPGYGKVTMQPGFTHYLNQVSGEKKVGTVSLHPAVIRLVERNKYENIPILANFPMLIPPRPWFLGSTGPYLSQRVPLVRNKISNRKQMEALEIAEMDKVYATLNVLGSVPFRINPFLHDTMLQAVEAGGGFGDLPPKEDLPPLEAPVFSPEEDPAVVAKANARFHHLLGKRVQENRDLHSLRCDLKLKLEVARMFRDDVMYFPHNLDFRGRVYPVPPHLNHMGHDISRGLLMFAEGKPLGERGLEWLKVRLSNLMGHDKISFKDRVKFVDENMEHVYDSADKPLNGARWWLKADDPWQALATCHELACALRSPSPADFVSALPIYQDGSCNGLQHYAALGRDALGGAAVNLVPGGKPSDVYSDVCAVVNKRVLEDSMSPPPNAPSDSGEYKAWEKKVHIAKMLIGRVDRKVVKQTVMTSVYGVTLIGARAQIESKLKLKFDDVDMSSEEKSEVIFKGSSYLAKVTMESIGELFSAADQIKEWLSNCAKLCGMAGQPMCWITPLGLPVVQPYRSHGSLTVRTLLQDVTLVDQDEQMPVATRRQSSAFPPNYVHSLDSTHMSMTALDCSEKGIVFTAVHDSYWTHACDVDRMNDCLRNQFVNLYQLPLLEQLRDSLVIRFPKVKFPPVPPRGDLDLELVRTSPYFFN